MHRVFLHLWTSIISGYKHHIETGEEVTSKTRLNTKAIRQIALRID
jgi:hypothetical protein